MTRFLVSQHKAGIRLVDLGPLQVAGVHEGALEVLDPRVLPLQQSLELQVRLRPMEEDDIHVHIVTILVEKVLQEHRDGLEGDVATNDNVPTIVRLIVKMFFYYYLFDNEWGQEV